ncbi:MAG: hypothetical protein AABX14_00690 [Candidatus Aenigmatarchaeota archaeon]
MPIHRVICDWNGALFKDRDEGKLWEYVGKAALKDSTVLGYVPMPRTVELLGAMLKLKNLVGAYKRGEIGYDEIYRVFNERVLRDLPSHAVPVYVEAYARMDTTKAKVDGRLLRPLAKVHEDQATSSAILSTGYRYGIRRVLQNAYPSSNKHPYHDAYPFYLIAANELVPIGVDKGVRFDLDIFTGDSKLTVLRQKLLGLPVNSPRDTDKTLYIGDSSTDEPCMRHIKSAGGHVAAPFFADDAFKQRIAREYDAFVPESEADFLNFLRKA